MSSFLQFLVYLVVIQGVFSATCVFDNDNNAYTCTLFYANVTTDVDNIPIDGKHFPGFDDSKVEEVIAQKSQFMFLPKGILQRFSQTSYLDLSDVSLTEITAKSIGNCAKLTKLFLKKNFIEDIEPGTFKSCSQLQYLKLSENRIHTLPTKTFVGLDNLIDLELSGNKIKEIRLNPFNGLKSLVILKINRNEIENQNVYLFENLTLETLDLSNNHITVFLATTIENVQTLRLSNNLVYNFSRPSRNLENLFLDSNQLKRITTETFNGMPNLLELDLVENLIYELEEYCFENLTKLSFLDLSSNDIAYWPVEAFNGLKSLKRFSMQRNPFTEIQNGAFSRLVSLEYLDISFIESKSISVTKLYENSFEKLENLKTLAINNREIEDLPSGVFVSLVKLEEISLKNNKIHKLSASSFGKLNKLKILIFPNNQIDVIETDFFRNFPSIETFDGEANQCINEVVSNVSSPDAFKNCFKNWNNSGSYEGSSVMFLTILLAAGFFISFF